MKTTAIDFETANWNPASVCAVGVSVMDEDGSIEEKYYTLIHPEDNVNWFQKGNMMIHHITPDMVMDAPSFQEIYPQLMMLFDGAIVCAHNARFDMTCLKQTCLNTGQPVPAISYFDTVALSRRAFPYLSHHRLDDMCTYLGVDLNHHHAGSDAYGCLMIVAACMNLSRRFDVEEMLKYYRIRINQL